MFFGNCGKSQTAYAKSETSVYAKALSYCPFYVSQTMSEDEILFVIPETYFVVVLGELSNQILKVQYKNYVGYITSDCVEKVSFIPIVKFLDNIKFDVKETSGTQVWSRPTTNSKVLTTVSSGSKNIEYISYVYGTIPSGGEKNVWYYCLYTPSENSTNVYEGYIYSENTSNLTTIARNLETNPNVIENETLGSDTILISSSVKTIIITIVAVPIILFLLIILYKFAKKFKNNTNKTIIQNQTFENNSNKLQGNLTNGELVQSREQNTQNLGRSTLKDKIENLKNEKFIRKEKSSKKANYPPFPDFESDDDWLWLYYLFFDWMLFVVIK